MSILVRPGAGSLRPGKGFTRWVKLRRNRANIDLPNIQTSFVLIMILISFRCIQCISTCIPVSPACTRNVNSRLRAHFQTSHYVIYISSWNQSTRETTVDVRNIHCIWFHIIPSGGKMVLGYIMHICSTHEKFLIESKQRNISCYQNYTYRNITKMSYKACYLTNGIKVKYF